MSTIRIASRAKFARVPNSSADDSTISFRARGILLFLLAKPDNWKANVEHVIANSDHEGRDAVRKAFNELVSAGYVKRERIQEKGILRGYNYTVYDTVYGLSVNGKPEDGKPVNQKPDTNKTNINKTKEIRPTTNVVEPKAPKQYGNPVINQVIEEWRRVTGLGIHSRVQMNRNAVMRMVRDHKLENVLGAIPVVAEMNRTKYATSIPDLEAMAWKWNDIRIYYEKNYGSGSCMTEINF